MDKLEYQQYLQSTTWQFRRGLVLTFWGHRCAVCNSAEHLEVHHRTYERVGCEHLTDLIPLCHDCHHMHYNQFARPEWEAIGPELMRYRQAIGEA